MVLFRAAVLPTLAAGLAVTLAAAVADGTRGLLGGLVGTAVVIGFFGLDVGIFRLAGRRAPTDLLALSLLGYLVKVGLLAVFLVAFRGTTVFSPAAFGVAVAAGTVCWLAVQVRLFVRDGAEFRRRWQGRLGGFGAEEAAGE